MPRPWSCCQEEASGEHIEPRSAKHLPFQHLQPIDVSFDGALTPGQGYGGSDGGHIRPEPSGEALEGRESTPGGARQPRFKVCELALADEGGKTLREGHRLCQLGRLYSQLRQLMVILGRSPRRRTEDQPGRPARRKPVPWRMRRTYKATMPYWPRKPWRRMVWKRCQPLRQPLFHPARRVALYGSRRLRPRPRRGWRSGNVVLWRYRGTVRQLSPTWCAIASSVQPYRWEVQTC